MSIYNWAPSLSPLGGQHLHLYNLESPPPEDVSNQIWLKSISQMQRRSCLKHYGQITPFWHRLSGPWGVSTSMCTILKSPPPEDASNQMWLKSISQMQRRSCLKHHGQITPFWPRPSAPMGVSTSICTILCFHLHYSYMIYNFIFNIRKNLNC